MTRKSKSLSRDFIWNTIGSGLYAFTSLFFLVIVTRINGVDDAGIFTFAFSNACVFQVLGTYAGRAYQVTEKDASLNDNVYVWNRLFSTIIMIVFGVLYGFVFGHTGTKLLVILILILYKALDAFAEAIYGVIQKNDRLYQVGVSLALKGVIGTALFFGFDLIFHDIVFASLALVLTSVVVMLFYDFPKVRACGYKFKKVEIKKALSIFRLGAFAFIFTLLTQYLISASKYAIDRSLSLDAQTMYGIVAMPASVMILAANFLTYPFLLRIKKMLKKNDYDGLNGLVAKLTGVIVAFGAVASLLAFLFGRWAFQLLYGVDTGEYIGGLVLIIVGGTLFAVSLALSNVLVAMRRTFSQAVAFIIASIAAFVLSGWLVVEQGVFGGTLAYFASMALLLILYIIIYAYYSRKDRKNEK